MGINKALKGAWEFCHESLVHNSIPQSAGRFLLPSSPKMRLREVGMSNMLCWRCWSEAGIEIEHHCVIHTSAQTLGQWLQQLVLCNVVMAILGEIKGPCPQDLISDSHWQGMQSEQCNIKEALTWGPEKTEYFGKFWIRNRKHWRKLSMTPDQVTRTPVWCQWA